MQLFGVQQAAFEAGHHKRGFAYYMEQGLGKTLTALTDFTEHVKEGNVSRLAVVAPNSFKGGWRSEIEKWGMNFDTFIWEAGADAEFNAWVKRGFSRPPVFITNYEAIRSERVQEHLRRFAEKSAMIVYDESIQISTYDSQQTKAAISLSPAFAYQRVLSGKPMKKGPHDLWSQMRAIGKQEGREYHAWKTLFCRMGGFKGKQVIGVQNEDYMATQINDHVFFAEKKDWTDLPPKLYTTREYAMTPEMQRQYDSMEEDFVLWLDDEEVVTVDAAITKYIKLAQIQTGWIYDEDGTVRSLVETAKNPRLKLLRSIIDDEVVGKTIVVYHHRPVLGQLMETFADLNPAYIKGQMAPAEIEEQKRRFNNDSNCRTIFIQTKAGKYGHTLLGGSEKQNHCSTTIFYENTYNSDDRYQLEDRNHRHGQLNDTWLGVDLSGTSLDVRMTAALQMRENIFNAVYVGLGLRSPSPEAS